ncbi:MAG: hypothetical protein AUH29_16050 [Candidatus Rokubacteria bacterium 13_1_40CM_69_27]|nr:MAG: hypothetical protein AUH29_16050 [Candidatus Rokubacteria bacterium 13_1_40CM_69_27]OLC39422.1 MAG: hypothetical protein AUH81_01730 [Candidatus Rokubacteria bacterium 13_1_40CM_4_69_5]OLE38212.1 MAG: hypothetical protein AUG00_05945 [Candidatus Rokubacteria bacterium 13_1_20CM_2_70_7]
MGQFRVTARLTGPTGLSEQTELLVDTGATLVVLPRSLADRLEVEARRLQPVIIAGGVGATWPVAEVRVTIDAQEVTTPCFIAPDGPALLGAVALESLFLAVDPVAKRLVPTKGLVL